MTSTKEKKMTAIQTIRKGLIVKKDKELCCFRKECRT